MTNPNRFTNRLVREKSPYLLQHAHNPVDWYPWGEEAFARARAENKPLFLSIGYSTCHWCHVMERESFEDPKLGVFLNRHFVCIKLDREERPDVDKIYMTFVQATTGAGGWPLNVFLTPDRKPFFGGTYFPPDSRYGRPGFLQLLTRIQELWETRREELLESATEAHTRLAQFSLADEAAGAPGSSEETLRRAGEQLKRLHDPRHGGFGSAPKFPQPSQPRFLLRYAKRFGDAEAVGMVRHTCERMAAGGLYDQLGGGFARYSVDAEWLVPHFEKMLYDNAQLVQLYLDVHLVTGEMQFADVARGILGYVLRDMTDPGGGFYSAEDADSEGHEGKFYGWTRTELEKLLSPEEFNVAVRHFGISAEGNFVDHSHPQPLPNQNVLHVAEPPATAGDRELLRSAKEKMIAARNQRVRPHRDDKVLASWNGLMLGAMARAYAVLGDEIYRRAAERNFDFLWQHLWTPSAGGGALYHRWREGERDQVELLEGYAFVLAGVRELYEATLEPGQLDFAIAVAESMLAKFYDSANGGFWQSPATAGDLILRVKDDYDGAEPSGNSVAALALLQLGVTTGRKEFTAAAERTLRLFSSRMEQMPQAVPFMLQALDFSLQEPKRVVVAGDPAATATRQLTHAVHSVYEPNKVVLGNRGPVEELARSLPAKDGGLVYLCTGNACQAPTDDAATIRRLLEQQ